MSTKELCSIREWAPLSVIERIPAHFSRLGGLFSLNLNVTCVAAVEDFLALGSDVGVVFWYNRQTGDVQKLRAEVPSRITCVKIVNSVEYMVAAGQASGQVSVFQIQKPLPADLDLPGCLVRRAKPIQRYTIRELHRSGVSCCEWSRNGMKLFSGDRQGVVVLTEFDFANHLSKSLEILSEAYEIVQLSVHQSYLLVSTMYRSVVCQRTGDEWRLIQVGKKDRKSLVDCGGIFLRRSNAGPVPLPHQQQQQQRPLIICARPGLRFWLADTTGSVAKTLLFREALAQSPTWEIPILNPKAGMGAVFGVQSGTAEAVQYGGGGGVVGSPADVSAPIVEAKNFGQLFVYDESRAAAATAADGNADALIVTHDGAALYVLNVDSLRVEAMARGFRKIIDFCVCGKEIFVLEGERSLLRLAPMPEKPNKTSKIIFNPFMPPPVPPLGHQPRNGYRGKYESPVECEPSLLFPSTSAAATATATTAAAEQSSPSAGAASVTANSSILSGAIECLELPPIETLHLHIHIELAVESPRGEQNRRLQLFNRIGEQEFDQSIVHHSGDKRQRRKSRDKSQGRSSSGGGGRASTAPGGIVEIGQAAWKETTSPPPLPGMRTAAKAHPQTLELTTQPTSLEASFCSSTQAAYAAPPPLRPQPALATADEPTASCVEHTTSPAPPSPPLPPQAPAPTPSTPSVGADRVDHNKTALNLVELMQAYPHQDERTTPPTSATTTTPTLEDAGVQTTPRKKFFPYDPLLLLHAGDGDGDGEGGCVAATGANDDEQHGLDAALAGLYDFSNGRPVDELYAPVHHYVSTTRTDAIRQPLSLRFVATQACVATTPTGREEAAVARVANLATVEIGSFLPDFDRAAEPFVQKKNAPVVAQPGPVSADSNNSNEWEFLDN